MRGCDQWYLLIVSTLPLCTLPWNRHSEEKAHVACVLSSRGYIAWDTWSREQKVCCCSCLWLSLKGNILHLRGSKVPQSKLVLSVLLVVCHWVTFTHDHFCRNELVQYVIESLFQGCASCPGLENCSILNFWRQRCNVLWPYMEWTHKSPHLESLQWTHLPLSTTTRVVMCETLAVQQVSLVGLRLDCSWQKWS